MGFLVRMNGMKVGKVLFLQVFVYPPGPLVWGCRCLVRGGRYLVRGGGYLVREGWVSGQRRCMVRGVYSQGRCMIRGSVWSGVYGQRGLVRGSYLIRGGRCLVRGWVWLRGPESHPR